jgi:hypothetical protein
VQAEIPQSVLRRGHCGGCMALSRSRQCLLGRSLVMFPSVMAAPHCPSIYLSVCLSVYPSIYLSACLCRLSVRLPICLSIYLSVCLSVYLSVRLPIYLSIYLSVCLSVYLSVRLPICLSIYLSVCLSVCITHLNCARGMARKCKLDETTQDGYGNCSRHFTTLSCTVF